MTIVLLYIQRRACHDIVLQIFLYTTNIFYQVWICRNSATDCVFARTRDTVCDLIGNIQTKYQQFKNPDVLNTILTAGAERARIVASETLNRAKVALGLK